MLISRVKAGVLALPLVFMAAACGGGGGDAAEEAPAGKGKATSPASKGSSEPAPGKAGLPEAGSTALPKAADPAALDGADSAKGLVLVQQDKDGGCVVLTLTDDGLRRLGTFPAFTGGPGTGTQDCDDRVYTRDFRTRVGQVDQHTVTQGIGQPEKDVSGGKTLVGPEIGPDDRIYVMSGSAYGKASVMDLDGSGLAEVPHGKSRPAWLGGTMVDSKLKAVSNADGSLAVEYVPTLGSGGSGYRVGKVNPPKGYGPAIDGDIAFPEGGEAADPLAWVGDDQFLTSGGGTLYLNTVTPGAGGTKPAVAVKELAALPEPYMTNQSPIGKVVVCGSTAYFTVSMGGTVTLADRQSAVLGVDVASGELTAYASVLNAGDPGNQYTTEVMGCVA